MQLCSRCHWACRRYTTFHPSESRVASTRQQHKWHVMLPFASKCHSKIRPVHWCHAESQAVCLCGIPFVQDARPTNLVSLRGKGGGGVQGGVGGCLTDVAQILL